MRHLYLLLLDQEAENISHLPFDALKGIFNIARHNIDVAVINTGAVLEDVDPRAALQALTGRIPPWWPGAICIVILHKTIVMELKEPVNSSGGKTELLGKPIKGLHDDIAHIVNVPYEYMVV